MITTVNGKKAIVKFMYMDRTTICAILDYETKNPIVSGTVRRHASDYDNRLIARKNALTKAIKTLPRSTRAGIWDDVKQQMRIK